MSKEKVYKKTWSFFCHWAGGCLISCLLVLSDEVSVVRSMSLFMT